MTLLLGLIVGVLFGLTGNGGSTLAVPLLVYGLHLRTHAAVCTSMIAVGAMATAMFTIALVSVAAMAAHFFAGQRVSLETTGLFTMGGLMGLWPGTWLAARLPGVWLARVLAVGLLLLGAFIVVHSLIKG